MSYNVLFFVNKGFSVLRKYGSTLINKSILCLYGVQFGKNLETNGLIYVRNGLGGGIFIGSNVTINSCRKINPTGCLIKTTLFTWANARITIGDNVGLSNTTIIASQSVTIGDNVYIGGGTQIYDTDHHSVIAQHRLNGNTHVPSAPVLIKKNCFIGADCKILKGVIIGEGSVVGAGSVVTKGIPDGEIWAGVPARFIKKVPKE